jgi:hypothetical protein
MEPQDRKKGALPPHPATVVQRRQAPFGAPRALPPHPATVVQRREAPLGAPRALPPHPATVVQRRQAPHQATMLGGSRPPHPAKVAQPRATVQRAQVAEEEEDKYKKQDCSECFEAIEENDECVRGHCSIFHKRCLGALKPSERSAYLFRGPIQGKPTGCSVCGKNVNPEAWVDLIGEDEVKRLNKIAEPPDEKHLADAPAMAGFGGFTCPKCGGVFIWETGCDYLSEHSCQGKMCRFHIIDGAVGEDQGKCVSRLGHSSYMRELISAIRKLKEKDPVKAYNALLALKGAHNMAWKALKVDECIARIENAISEKAAPSTASELVGPAWSGTFTSLVNILNAYAVSKLKSASKKKWCYLTSACVDALGLPDDCAELTALRRFRDGYLGDHPRGAALIREYYRDAPAIVAGIGRRAEAPRVYAAIYRVVCACVSAIEDGQPETALALYEKMVIVLRDAYRAPGSPHLLDALSRGTLACSWMTMPGSAPTP